MKWLDKLWKKAPVNPPAPAKPQTPRATGENIDGLRDELAAAADADARGRLTERLGRALAELAQAPRGDDAREVRVAAIRHASDKALALAWLAALEGEAALGEVATQARNAEVRYAAARRIETTSALEQVAQSSRDKDKRVYRHCNDLLKQRRQASTCRQRVEEIADELRRLLDNAPLPHTRLLDLKKELATLTAAEASWSVCDALMEQALAQLRQESEALRDLHALQNAAAVLSSECADTDWPWHERIADWRARLADLDRARDALPAWLADPARALQPRLREIDARIASCAADAEHAQACERFLAALESGVASETGVVSETDPASETDASPAPDPATAWQTLAKPAHATARHALELRWQEWASSAPAVAKVDEAPQVDTVEPTPPTQPRRQLDQDALRVLLDQLEQAIGAGHLQDADAAAKRIKTLLGNQHPRGALESRLQQLHGELETLRGWARWGTGQAREHLIAAARDLLEGEREVEELARAIPALREEWKRLNAHSPSTKAQWESFDAALEQAYQPVAAHRAETEARQAEARAAREAQCEAWEAEVAAIVWEDADFKVIEQRRADMIAHWRAAPRMGPRDERTMRKRFDSLIGAIDQQLEAARATERDRREQLIAEAEALKDQADLRRAMNEAKSLNQRWSQQPRPVRFNRGEEQKQWQRFRAACDAVFARNEALRADQNAQRVERNHARRALLDDFASTLATADDEVVKRMLVRFNADWQSQHADARDNDDSLEQRARELRQQAQQRLDQARLKQRQANYALLARKAALAEQVEAAVLGAQPLDSVLAKARQTWDTLPPLPDHGERLLAERLAQAATITSTVLAGGRETRAALLLDLEIALGLPSPEVHAEARRERQLERLRNRFTTEGAPLSEPESLLIRCYATAAEPDPDHDQRLEAVKQQLVEHGFQDPGR